MCTTAGPVPVSRRVRPIVRSWLSLVNRTERPAWVTMISSPFSSSAAHFPGEEPREQLRDRLRVLRIPRLARDRLTSPNRVPDGLNRLQRVVHELPDQAKFATPDGAALGRG